MNLQSIIKGIVFAGLIGLASTTYAKTYKTFEPLKSLKGYTIMKDDVTDTCACYQKDEDVDDLWEFEDEIDFPQKIIYAIDKLEMNKS